MKKSYSAECAAALRWLQPSTVIRHFQHDPRTRRLLVVFRSGRRYVYDDVPEAEAEAMRRAFSKGEYFNAHIRDRYAFERLD